MEYKNRAKNRRLKRTILSLIGVLKFKWLNLSLWEKISLIWALISTFSLFLNWIDSESINNLEEKGNAFSSLAGSIWYIILLILAFLVFILISHSKKETFKLSSDLHFKDSTITIFWWVFDIFLSLITFSFVKWLQRFSSTIIYGNGIILSITWAIVIIIWGIIMRKEKKAEKYSTYTNELGENEIEEENDNNMKLPF